MFGLLTWTLPAAALIALLALLIRLRVAARAAQAKHAALVSSEERYRALFEFTTDGVICLQSDGVVISANPAATGILGLKEEEMNALRPWEIWHQMQAEDGSELSPEQTPSAIAMREKHHVKDLIVSVIHWQSGQRIWLQLESIPLWREGESSPSQVIAVFMDVTEQRRNEDRFRVMVDASPNVLWMIDSKGCIALANSASFNVLGYTQQELLGMRANDLVPLGPHLDMPRELAVGTLEESRATRKDGRQIAVEFGLTPIQTTEGSFTLATVVDVTARKEAEKSMVRLAYYDQLTGLPNRRLFLERLQRAVALSTRHHQFGALLFLDIDNFKTINDTIGHDAGDLMLQEVAERLHKTLRESDTVARMGGDEFVLLLEEIGSVQARAADRAREVAEKVVARLAQPYQIRGRALPGSASLGVALWGGERIEDVNDLMKRSDMAMYDAKQSGKNTIRFFDPAMQRELEHRSEVEVDLHRAIVENQFVLHYQPRVDSSGRVWGAEALVRWQHPLRGLVPPLEFIPIAEQSGLIVAIGRWVMEAACRQLNSWAAAPQTAGLTISVNISAAEFRQDTMVDEISRILNETGANPQLLELEITESVLFENVEASITKMLALRELGLTFSLDDFGTGYSSLSYLKKLPLHLLKIDKSFVNDLETDSSDGVIVQTIIRMGQTLGLVVVAEGVETDAQRDILVRLGCVFFQGYLFGKPMPIKVYESALGSQAA
jgi:diguanylate cyclase (GGDEF)-like protein/PAS domain S-box-containing protein